MSGRKSENLYRAVFESLEDRRLLSSVSFSNGVLPLTGDENAANKLTVFANEHGRVWGLANNNGTSVSVKSVKSIHIIGGSGADLIEIDPRLHKPTTIDAGAGDDTIRGGGGPD